MEGKGNLRWARGKAAQVLDRYLLQNSVESFARMGAVGK